MHFAVTIYCTIISKILKIRQKFKNDPIVKKNTSRVANFVFNICVKLESYPIKTVGGDRFWKIV